MTATQPYQPVALNGGARGGALSQATAIEQSRAIAEVQAAVVVAQNCPRNMQEAEAEMEYVCGRMDMAEQAFYSVVNRGNGASVHLMRELARIWGNVDYGVKELARNDDAGESEVQAFAWDMQRNTRSSRTFIVPHARMARGRRTQLTDLGDIYLNNQNIGARAVRECIATILPRWFTEKAQDICQATLENGEGEPLQDRIATMVAWFGTLGVTEKQMETRLGKKRGQWDAGDVAQMKIAGKSIQRGEAQADDLFPPDQSAGATADEIMGTAAPAAEDPKAARTRKTKAKAQPAPEPEVQDHPAANETTHLSEQETLTGVGDTNEARTEVQETTPADPGQGPEQETSPLRASARAQHSKAIFATFSEVGLGKDENREDRLIVVEAIVGRRVASTKDLKDDELQKLRNALIDRKRDGVLEDDINEWLNAAAFKEAMAQEAAAEAAANETNTEGN